MKYSTRAFVSFVLAATLASAAPTGNSKSKASNAGKNSNSKVVGSAFFIVNDGGQNFVVANGIGADGKLTSARAFSTQGRGSHGNATGPDALFSQGSVKVLGNNLFVVNAGSNTLSMFAIGQNDPTQLSLVGFPASSQGEFPVSIAVSAKSKNICTLNGGQFNSVQCFTPDQKLGLLPVDNSFREIGIDQTAGVPTGPAGTVSHLLFNTDATKLVAAVKGVPPNPGFLAVWDVAADGSLSEQFKAVTPPTGGLLPFGMSNFPLNPSAMLVTDPGVGFDVIDLDEALATKADAKSTTAIKSLASSNIVAAGKSTANKVDGQVAVCWAAFSKKTSTFFMTDIGTSKVTEVSVDPKTLAAKVVKQYSLGDGTATIDDEVATINGKDFLYVLAANATTVEVMSLPAAGKAKQIQSFKLAPGKHGAVNIDANNLQGMAVFVKQ
jgi:hypothetical protein